MSKDTGENNLFMMCRELNRAALSDIPAGYTIRPCREDEIDIWKAIHFDSAEAAKEFRPFMDEYFELVYRPEYSRFMKNCLFICDADDRPVGTCFAWKAYGCVTTIHWFKIIKSMEGMGLGRALLSHVMRSIPENEYPVFLHTHAGSIRAMKLYSDMGFALITDEMVGYRSNDLSESMDYLKENLEETVFESLRYAKAPAYFLEAALSTEYEQF